MNKYTLRAFSTGAFFTTLILFIAYWINDDEPKDLIDQTEAKAYIEEQGYLVLTKEEMNELVDINLADNKPVKEADNEEETTITAEIKIENGMLPQEVAQQLEDSGIIEHSEDFTTFLEEFNFSQKLRVGTYEVDNQMSYKELANLFSKS